MSRKVGEILVDKTNTKINRKPPWEQWLCTHDYDDTVRTVYDSKGKKRYVKTCIKCGKQDDIEQMEE